MRITVGAPPRFASTAVAEAGARVEAATVGHLSDHAVGRDDGGGPDVSSVTLDFASRASVRMFDRSCLDLRFDLE